MQRQYSGTAGRIENCQLGVFLAYATPSGRALPDRRLYLPAHTWLADPARCQAAGVPDEIAFATKPALATGMVLAALEAGVPACWVAGDEVYGQDPRLRAALEERRMGYVLAIAGNRRVELEGVHLSAAEVAARVADRHWHHYRAGQGAKGAALVCLGLGAYRRGRDQGVSVASGQAQPDRRRAGVLPLLRVHPSAADGPGQDRWYPMGGRGVIPGCQGPGRPGPLPGTRLDGLAPAHHLGHARAGPARSHRRRTAPQTIASR